MPDDQSSRDHLAAQVSDLARSSGRIIAVAESLTGGMVATALAAAEAAGEWFRGSPVAYSSEAKHELLGVPDGPVVSAEAARAMAREVRRLLRADVAVAVTARADPPPRTAARPGRSSSPLMTASIRWCCAGTSRASRWRCAGGRLRWRRECRPTGSGRRPRRMFRAAGDDGLHARREQT
ncbi:MAG: CinA family protein [Pseudonocardia sp.]